MKKEFNNFGSPLRLNHVVFILFVALISFVPFNANAQFLKKLLGTVGEVLSDNSSSSGGTSRNFSPLNSKGQVKIPAVVFSNPYSNSDGYERSEGSIGTEWKRKGIPNRYSLNHVFEKSYAGIPYCFVITDTNKGYVTLASIGGFKADYEIPERIKWEKTGRQYIVEAIGANAFQSRSINSIDFPPTISQIGYEAFLGSKMETFKVPSSVTLISARAFADCKKLKSVYIPASVKEIGYGVFANCTSLENIIVDENNKYYKSVNGVLYNKSMTELIQYPCGKKDRTYTAPSSLISVNRQAFYKCWYLEDVVLPYGVKYISVEAFNNARLHNLYLPSSICEIGAGGLATDNWYDSYSNPVKTNVIIESNQPIKATQSALKYYNTSYLGELKLYVKKGSRKLYLEEEPWSDVEEVIEAEFIKK
ncbi:MAG: leucine-rich repeat domain-containing protein [Prevotella sp.]|nr:leucine-rich repeat domain-containing protein [Prevotella sp.]